MKDHIERPLDCETKEIFLDTYEDLRKTWTQGFLSYFDNILKDDMIHHACKFVTSVFPAFAGDITATNNISESFNRILKEEANWKEWPVDTMVLLLYYVQTFYSYEFQRGQQGLGNWHLKEKFKDRINLVQYSDLPRFKSLKDIVGAIKHEHAISKGVEKGVSSRMTQKALAKMCVENGHIGFSCQTSSFTVLSVDGKKVEAVRLFPQPASCSCPSTGLCYHIMAVKMAVGLEDGNEQRRSYSLSVMRRRKRGKETKSGRKKARKHDYDYTVNPAPDSLLVMEDEIPTATSSPFRLSKHLHEMEQSPIHADVTPDQFEEMDIDQPSQRTSTPGLSTSTHHNPWDEDTTPVLLQLQHCMATAPAYIQNALSTLDDRQWLCSDAIDESIQGILTSSSSQDVCLLCLTYIYQSVAMDSFDIAFTYLKQNDSLNKDILIIPLNLDPQGKGTH